MVVPVFITGIRIKENECAFSLLGFQLEKVHFSHCFIQNLEEIESLKNENSPGKVLEFCFPIFLQTLFDWEHSGSVVECLSQDQGVAGSSLTGFIALCL